MKTRILKRKRSKEEKQTLIEWQSGRWHTHLPEQAMQCVIDNSSAENLYLALKILHALRKPRTDDLAAIEALMCQSKRQFLWSDLALRMLCAHLQSGCTEAAHALLHRYMPGRPGLLATCRARRFPMALAFIAEYHNDLLNDILKQQAIRAQELQMRTLRVDKRLMVDSRAAASDDNKDAVTVAVVGNSPTLLDKPEGHHIDEHDVVVRFNAAVLTEKYQRYSGRRTDVWVVSPASARHAPMRGIRSIIVSGINVLAGESGYWRHLARHDADKQLAQFEQETWYQLVATLQAPPTAGLLMLQSLANIDGLSVSALGFSGNCNKSDIKSNTCSEPRRRANHYADNQPASTRHNWTAEAKLLAEWCKS